MIPQDYVVAVTQVDISPTLKTATERAFSTAQLNYLLDGNICAVTSFLRHDYCTGVAPRFGVLAFEYAGAFTELSTLVVDGDEFIDANMFKYVAVYKPRPHTDSLLQSHVFLTMALVTVTEAEMLRALPADEQEHRLLGLLCYSEQDAHRARMWTRRY